ncbi:UDP-N-acetylmuramoyl-tripeptide--D-alanyl-D-alanine ligase [Allomuricauda sp. d1]|uniref:UDP-N-acetylmuramoyl-tripeptide--D-alanyl-D- alanine ligase n=1 Tax=Allomuricauda sp. d1 TaxID=3136725 RepID=UPI0031DE4BF6
MILSELHQLFLRYPNACTDTRKITKDCIFFALKGPNFNGSEFAQEALKKGAAYAVVDEKKFKTDEKVILVDDVLHTLQELGTYHRNHCKARIIALTGSNGKTTTKELINAVLSKKYKTVATQGNLNNHIGVPLTLLSIKEETEIGIIEMGANHQGEIAFLSTLAQPDFGYITNFGKAHLEGFGGVEGVIKGKSELYTYLIDNKRIAFLNADDPIQKEKLLHYVKKYGYSQNDHEYFTIELVQSNPFVELKVEGTIISTQLIGAYNFQNCCVAVLIGKYFNVPMDATKEAIESYVPKNNRSQLIEKKGKKIVLDAYNANPTSMRAALENFDAMDANPKIAFLGDMFELGEDAAAEHQSIVDLVSGIDIASVFLVGDNFSKTDSTYQKFQDFESLKKHLQQYPIQEDAHIFIKGSRGMALERLLDIL